MASQQFHDISIKSENVTKYRSLQRGDHLSVEGSREVDDIEYYHHGIFLGHEKGVVDFGGANKDDAKVRIVDLFEFTDFGKRRLVRINYSDEECLSPEEAASNAEELFHNPSRWGAYDLISNNCEHFATKCKTGVAVSFQVIEKIRSCQKNPLQIIRYAIASAGQSGSGSFGSLRILSKIEAESKLKMNSSIFNKI